MKNVACNSTKQKLSTMIFGLTLLLMSVANVSFAKNVTLTWDANQEADVAGYNVYYGTSPGVYVLFKNISLISVSINLNKAKLMIKIYNNFKYSTTLYRHHQ